MNDFEFDQPKGFSSFTMGVRCKTSANPPAVLYRHLDGKENAILNFDTEKEIFLKLGESGIAPHCYYYDENCRIEAFYQGRTLVKEDLFLPDNLRAIANELFKFHQLIPVTLPQTNFFDMVHDQWGQLAKNVLINHSHEFPANESAMCEQLHEIYSARTLEKVMQCIPSGELCFCHNDTYYGNIMKLQNGEIKLLDFEFSCLNYKTYDFSNLFAETVMQHQLSDYPYFRIVEPQFGDNELGLLINFYLDNESFNSNEQREEQFNKLLAETKSTLILSDYKYAMAAITLAVNPIQKIRFIPYALARFRKFLAACDELTSLRQL